jgi:hypothetical protein
MKKNLKKRIRFGAHGGPWPNYLYFTEKRRIQEIGRSKRWTKSADNRRPAWCQRGFYVEWQRRGSLSEPGSSDSWDFRYTRHPGTHTTCWDKNSSQLPENTEAESLYLSLGLQTEKQENLQMRSGAWWKDSEIPERPAVLVLGKERSMWHRWEVLTAGRWQGSLQTEGSLFWIPKIPHQGKGGRKKDRRSSPVSVLYSRKKEYHACKYLL